MKCKFAWLVALTAVLLTGCGSARPAKYYQLNVPGNTPSAAGRNSYSASLLLGPLRASHLYREDHIVYSMKGDQMGTYEYQRWSEPPTEMLQEFLLRQLRSTGRYRTVELLRSNSRGDFILYGRLYDFKEIPGMPVSTRVTMEAELREVKTGSTVWTHYYSHDEPAAEKDIAAVVAALNRNAQKGVDEIISNLDQYFSAHPAN